MLTLILLGGLLTIFVTGSVDAGGMSALIDRARRHNHFARDSFSFNPTSHVSLLVGNDSILQSCLHEAT